MKFDELDSYVEELFNRPVYLPDQEYLELRPAISIPPPVTPTTGENDLLYYWHEPYEHSLMPETELGTPMEAWDPGEPLSIRGMIKGLLLLVTGLLLIIGLSEAGLI